MAEFVSQQIALFNACMNKAEYKEKLGRAIQYGTRMITGILTEVDAATPNKDRANLILKSALGDSRRTFRFFKEFTFIPSLPKEFRYCFDYLFAWFISDPDPVNVALGLSSKVSLIAFFMADHYLWLQKVKIVNSGRPSETLKTAMKFFLLTHFLNLVLQLKKLKELQSLVGTPKYSEEKKSQIIQQIVKALLLVVQASHLSGVFETNNVLVGLAGLVSSGMDLHTMWHQEASVAQRKKH